MELDQEEKDIEKEMNDIGEKGKSSEIDRVIEIKMYDSYFEPTKINIKKDER